ncbi:MAG: class I SAM-dependent methyltransferase [Acidobacteria bacterium]|nr:class I SAM-dependent methyltransferase [Acidobacteriota bacterium]
MSAQAPHIFTPEYYEQLARFELHHPWSAHMRGLTFALLDRFSAGRAMDRVLDAGCGAGYFLQVWRERGRIPLAVGLDCACDGLRLGRSRGLKHLAAGSVAALPFPARLFDAVHCADVLQHLDTEAARRTLAEFARVLRPGGLLLVRTAARRGLGAKKHRDTADYQQWEPEKLRAWLAPCGFRVEWMSLINWLPSLAADLRAWRQPAPGGDVGLRTAAAPPGGLRQSLLAAYWRMEEGLLLRLRCRLPGGHTLLCVARKP